MGSVLRLVAAAFCVLCLHVSGFAANEPPQTFTLDGQLYQYGTNNPLLDAAAKITIQVINANGTCLLYEEEQTVDTHQTKGFFTIHVGSPTSAAKRTVNDPGRSMNQVFQNTLAISANSVPGQTCAGGVYTPVDGAIRYVRLTVTPSATNIADRLTPDIAIDSVPSALVAQSVQGLERSNILQVFNTGSTVLTQANLEAIFTTPAYTNLQSILAGNFMPIDSSGASLPSYAANPPGVANGDIWFDTVTNEIKYKNAAGVQVVGTSGGGISSLTVGSSMSVNGSVAGTISGSGTIDLSNTGVTAGTYTKMTVDAKGRVTAGTISLVESDIPNLSSAGKVSGNTMTSGTISGSTAINTSGNLATTGTISGLTVQATNLRVYNGASYLQMTAATMSGNVNLTLPATTGSAGQFLSTDGNGILSWSGLTSLLAGDVSGAFGSTSVDKIKGKSVTAATVSGQMMIYDGTAWGNSVVSGDATLAHDGMLTLNKVPVSKGGTNAVTFGNNKIISSNGTGSTLQDFSCSLNQVIAFDASGYAVCANVSSLSAAILNGGNTTGAAISIGTNDNKAFQIKVNNATAMTISQNGNVGIGAAAPAAKLEVAGDLKVGNSSATCDNTTKGSIRYNNASSVLEFCNGTSWNLIQAAACSDATPAVFSFNDEANATASTLYTSNIIQITGINCTVPVTVSGGGSPQFQICSDAGCGTVVQGWTSSPSSISNNQYLQLRLTTDTVGGAQFQATVIVGSGASVWSVTNAGGDCTGSPTIGTVCADGTIYAGLSPDGNVKMFTTRCDAGQTWDGISCTGSRAVISWNNGTGTYTNTGITGNTTGKSNSANLAAYADGGSPYVAAQYCETLNINGKTDWYLPAQAELHVLYTNKAVIRNFDLTATEDYWVSVEYNNSGAWYQRFSDGYQWANSNNKNNGNYVRCVRR